MFDLCKDAQDSFTDWFQQFHHGAPEKPTLTEGATFTDKVAYEHRQKQYEEEQERWQQSLQLQTRATVDRLYNVLLFVEGWMVDQRMVSFLPYLVPLHSEWLILKMHKLIIIVAHQVT